ncbi:Ig-like domain-containing protein, partial [Planktothrix serta]|uniref:Ig-like domain-containing protein n=1 Tax=Planktothrix serta TaxID=1678310 RepID=UPI0018CC281B
NDIPTSNPNNTTINEDQPYTFSSTDFPFSDVDTGDTLQTVKITELPANGQLFYNGTLITSLPVGGLDIPIANIAQLQFQPDPNENGTNYANFKFQVGDGTDFSGDNTFTVNVTPVNDIPTSNPNNTTINEDQPYTFSST